MVTIVSRLVTDELGIPLLPITPGEPTVLAAANGSKLSIDGEAIIVFDCAGLHIPHRVKVVSDVAYDIIFGTDFLVKNQIDIRLTLGCITIFDDLVRLPLRRRFSDVNLCVITDKPMFIPAFTEALIPVKCPQKYNDKSFLVEPIALNQFRDFTLARSISHGRNGIAYCKVLNHNEKPIVLKKRTKVGLIEELDNVVNSTKQTQDDRSAVAAIGRPIGSGTEHATPVPSQLPQPIINGSACRQHVSSRDDNYRNDISVKELETFADDYKFNLNPDLTSEQRKQLLLVLYKNKAAFARDLSEVTQHPTYQLKLQVAVPHNCFKRQYRLHPDHVMEIDRQVKELQKFGFIEPSMSTQYNTAVFLIEKRDKTMRFIMDLRAINDIIVPQVQALPRIRELIDEISSRKASWFSLTDLKSGFFQLKLHEGSRDLTSFTNPRDGSRWRWTICPFGLQASPAACLTLINQIFSGRLDKLNASVYVDDILVASPTFEEHLTNLDETLTLLRANRLTCNPTKTDIGMSKIDFLGHEISKNGIRMSDKKIKAIKAIQPPKSVKSLQRVYGMINFWRPFIADFNRWTYNMRQLLLKDTKFYWSTECQQELDHLKQCLISRPILQPIDTMKDLTVMTDASSKFGLGWVYLQPDENGDLKVVSYGAQALTPSQRNYSALELELLSLISALKILRC